MKVYLKKSIVAMIKTQNCKTTVASLFVLMRLLFGFGWMMAGVTKLTDKSWFSEPGVFLESYLLASLQNERVPGFYKLFLEHLAMDGILFLNYAIPLAQIAAGLCLIIGCLTVPGILLCLFMHINFILSGNMNPISLVLFISAILLLTGRTAMLQFSIDTYRNKQPSTISSVSAARTTQTEIRVIKPEQPDRKPAPGSY